MAAEGVSFFLLAALSHPRHTLMMSVGMVSSTLNFAIGSTMPALGVILKFDLISRSCSTSGIAFSFALYFRILLHEDLVVLKRRADERHRAGRIPRRSARISSSRVSPQWTSSSWFVIQRMTPSRSGIG